MPARGGAAALRPPRAPAAPPARPPAPRSGRRAGRQRPYPTLTPTLTLPCGRLSPPAAPPSSPSKRLYLGDARDVRGRRPQLKAVRREAPELESAACFLCAGLPAPGWPGGAAALGRPRAPADRAARPRPPHGPQACAVAFTKRWHHLPGCRQGMGAPACSAAAAQPGQCACQETRQMPGTLSLRFVTGQSAARDQLLAPERSLWQPIDHPAGWKALARCLMMLPLGDARARTRAAQR